MKMDAKNRLIIGLSVTCAETGLRKAAQNVLRILTADISIRSALWTYEYDLDTIRAIAYGKHIDYDIATLRDNPEEFWGEPAKEETDEILMAVGNWVNWDQHETPITIRTLKNGIRKPGNPRRKTDGGKTRRTPSGTKQRKRWGNTRRNKE